jgi:hypothetical protein
MFIGEILANMTQVSDVAPEPLVFVIVVLYIMSYTLPISFKKGKGCLEKCGIIVLTCLCHFKVSL